jgi:hypothetical protein
MDICSFQLDILTPIVIPINLEWAGVIANLKSKSFPLMFNYTNVLFQSLASLIPQFEMGNK